ncbi:unnamed protein product [Durusdinium trenchii]|uniref:Tyrosine-protein kinase ephrin type A/B receptor-like domain-containing protein n=1 Tax=Durusdinium trenchii TaxID=1381693 RepID=A0ABP0JLB7_9DINO
MTLGLLLALVYGAKAHSWCEAKGGSCLGQLHRFEKQETPSLVPCSHDAWFGTRHHHQVSLRLADWDGDGDVDFLCGKTQNGTTITLQEQLPDGSLQSLELLRSTMAPWHDMDIEVADWNGDGKMDLLLCTEEAGSVTVSWLEHSVKPCLDADVKHFLFVNGSECKMHTLQAVDFDEDGDVDLFLGQRYFERISNDTLIERVADENPISIFDGKMKYIIDMDGDGSVEVLMDGWAKGRHHRLRYFRRAADGSFIESPENPFADISVTVPGGYWEDMSLVDWNSDGLPDILLCGFMVDLGYVGAGHFVRYDQHVLDLDLIHNSQMDSYADIDLGGRPEMKWLSVGDWNGDGFLDVVVSEKEGIFKSDIQRGESPQPKLYENRPEAASEVVRAFENVTATFLVDYPNTSYWRTSDYRTAVADFDGDGELDLIILSEADGKLHYHRKISGNLQAEEPRHLFSNITTEKKQKSVGFYLVQPIPVDWDKDGDMDLILGFPDGRLFQQVNGTLQEWPLEQSPVRNLLAELDEFSRGKWWWDEYDIIRVTKASVWRFVDCDGDGDMDMIRLKPWYEKPCCVTYPIKHQGLQACEQTADGMRCDDDFLCLGTNLSNFKGDFGDVVTFDLGDVADGRLSLLAANNNSKSVLQWSAGFCTPKGACYDKGFCLRRQMNCSCIAGYELGDCSGCEPNFHSLPQKLGQLHSCRACPGNGMVCHGRGSCFDDAAAKREPQESTAALTAKGNGSCVCHEEHFFGSDEEGRITCVDGNCPAGSAENDGRCEPCDAGAFSLEGGACKKCSPGTFSLAASGTCLACPRGTISSTPGASACEACPSGRYEFQQQFCSECPAGFASSSGNNSCSKCPAGYFAPEPGSSTCVPCALGLFSYEGSATCSACPAGKFSTGATCKNCEAGHYAPERSSTCLPCPGGLFSEEGSAKCIACPAGSISVAASGGCSECEAGFFAKDSITCEPCPGGTRSSAASSTCQSCPAGEVSSPKSAVCTSCKGVLVRATPDFAKQSCQILALDVVLVLIAWIAAACLCFLCLTGFAYGIPVADVSAQGAKLVVTTSLAHFLLTWARPEVTFSGTGVPDLDSKRFSVKPLSSFQLTLSASESSLDTSMGHLHVKSLRGFLVMGFWRCPLIGWCILFLGVFSASISQISWSLTLVVSSLGMCTGALAFALRRRQGRTPLVKRYRQFFKEWPLALECSNRGPERSMAAGQLQDFIQFFETFIKDRSMYYVCSNIIKPLTEPYQLSFVEVVGSTKMEWFVSHYWGMSVRHFGDAIRKHALSYREAWRDSGYWICTFSNNQWRVEEAGSSAPAHLVPVRSLPHHPPCQKRSLSGPLAVHLHGCFARGEGRHRRRGGRGQDGQGTGHAGGTGHSRGGSTDDPRSHRANARGL